MNKRTALSHGLRYGITYLIMWAILGVVILENAPHANANLTQAGLLRAVVMFHAAFAIVAATEALARSAWRSITNLR